MLIYDYFFVNIDDQHESINIVSRVNPLKKSLRMKLSKKPQPGSNRVLPRWNRHMEVLSFEAGDLAFLDLTTKIIYSPKIKLILI